MGRGLTDSIASSGTTSAGVNITGVPKGAQITLFAKLKTASDIVVQMARPEAPAVFYPVTDKNNNFAHNSPVIASANSAAGEFANVTDLVGGLRGILQIKVSAQLDATSIVEWYIDT